MNGLAKRLAVSIFALASMLPMSCTDNITTPSPPKRGTVNVTLSEGPYSYSIQVWDLLDKRILGGVNSGQTGTLLQLSPKDYKFAASGLEIKTIIGPYGTPQQIPIYHTSNESYLFYVNADQNYDINFTMN